MEKFDTKKYERMKIKELTVIIPTLLVYFATLLYSVNLLFMHILEKTELQVAVFIILSCISAVSMIIIAKKFGSDFISDTKVNDIIKNYIDKMPCSDETVKKLQDTIASPLDPADRFYLQCLLADQAAKRGEKQYAEQVIFSANTDVFDKYPKLTMDYYAVMIEIYYLAGDYESVRCAYSEGEEYFKEYGSSNALMYRSMMDIYISSCLAYGNYPEAERVSKYRLNKVHTEKTDAVAYWFYIIQTAECSLRNKNIYDAFELCRTALQTIPQGTFAAYKALELMKEINSYRQQ